MHASVGLTDDAQTAFSSGRFPDALALIDQALLAWPINEDAIRLKKQIDTEKNKPAQTQDQAKAQGANAVKKPQATPTPTSVAADETEKPFYMTVQGAILITAGTILVIGGLTMSGRRKKSQTPVKKGK